MKRLNITFYDIINNDNIIKAINKSSKGKSDRKIVQYYLTNTQSKVPEIRQYIKNFKNENHDPMIIYDSSSNKERIIYIPYYKEQIVHHALVRALQPMFMKGMYEDSYASIPERGAFKASRKLQRIIDKGGSDIKYYLKIDIRKFFNSIDQEILFNKLSKEIHDKKILKLIKEILNVIPGGIGLPLGFYTSQWFANYYLESFDHFVKEELHIKYYFRYMDDMVFFCSNKRKLRQYKEKIFSYLNNELHLTVKSNYQINRFHYIKKNKYGIEINKGQFLDFMGFKFYRNRTVLRKRIYKNIIRLSVKISKRRYGPTLDDCRSILSYMGWLYYTDTLYIYKEIVKPNVNIGYCKCKISKHDKNL